MADKNSHVMNAFNKAKDAQIALYDQFKKSALPVETVSIVWSEGTAGIGIHLSRDPSPQEIPQLPNEYDGVSVGYYTRRNGKTFKYDNWS